MQLLKVSGLDTASQIKQLLQYESLAGNCPWRSDSTHEILLRRIGTLYNYKADYAHAAEYYNRATNKFRCAQNSIWSDCITGFNTVVQAADLAATQSSTTLQNDASLVFTPAINNTFVFDAWLPVDYSNATANLKIGFTIPAGASIGALVVAGGASPCSITVSGGSCSVTTGNAAYAMIQIHGAVIMGATAGNVQLQFAQNTSTAASFPVIKKGAMITWRQQ